MKIQELKKWVEELGEVKKKRAALSKEDDKLKKEQDEFEALITEFLVANQLERFDNGKNLVSIKSYQSFVYEDAMKARETLKKMNIWEDNATIGSQALNSILKKEYEKEVENGNLTPSFEGIKITEYKKLSFRGN